MVRHRLLGPVRLSLVAALLGALLVVSAGVVSAAAAITVTPGTATASSVGNNTFVIPFTSITADLDVNCGAPTAVCSVWVARNNAPKASEALFTNVTGSRSTIPAAFINDGCFNFRVYDSAHGTQLASQLNIGHGALNGGGPIPVCNSAAVGAPLVLVDTIRNRGDSFPTGKTPAAPSQARTIDWDSGFTGGVEDTQVWISQSQPSFAFTDCATIAYPNASEILYAQNVSGEQADLNILGGGPYCFTLYQGTSHTTKIGTTASFSLGNYLEYAGGTPNGAFDPTQGTIYYNSGNGATNALVCVYGTATGGSVVPFDFNSMGYGHKVASFQTANGGGGTTFAYQLRTGVTGLDGSGAPTKASCASGTLAQFFSIHT